jgi:competence protein ComEC
MNFLWRLKRRVHTSWLIAACSAGIIIGVIVAQYTSDWFGSISWLLVGINLAAVAVWRQRIYIIPVVLIAGGLIGLWRGSIDQHQLHPYHKIIGHHATLSGNVSEDADVGKGGELVLRLKAIQIDGHDLIGNVWVSASTTADIKRGDRVTMKGKAAEGFGSFAASMYRANVEKVQRPQPGDVARQVRDGFADQVRLAITEPEASLGLGYLVGQRRGLPPELADALQVAGLTHVVVASGYNLTILVRLARRLFVKISKYMAAFAAGGMIVAFIAVTGMSPSMSRAGLVASLGLLAWYYGRKFHPLVLLPFAAAVTLLVNPSYGWNDLGWQLSFAAFAGVMIVAPLLQAYFFGDKKPGTVRQILGETISAQIATLPILVLAFGQFSNVAILANLLVLPLVPLAMLLTFLAGIVTLIMPAAATIAGWPASALLQYMTTVAEYAAGLPWAQTTLQISGWVVAGAYLVLAGACVYMWRKTGFRLREANLVE